VKPIGYGVVNSKFSGAAWIWTGKPHFLFERPICSGEVEPSRRATFVARRRVWIAMTVGRLGALVKRPDRGNGICPQIDRSDVFGGDIYRAEWRRRAVGAR